MKKILFKIVNILLIITSFSSIVPVYAENEIIGSIKCPSGSEGKCVGYDSNGNVTTNPNDITKIEVTETNNDITVTKIVEKTNKVGTLNVSFKIKGKGPKTEEINPDAYVVVLLDMSNTIWVTEENETMSNVLKANAAITAFSEKLSKKKINSMIYLFASESKTAKAESRTKFSTNSFTSNEFLTNQNKSKSRVGYLSHIGTGLANAYKILKNVPSSSLKYVVVFGDGRYWEGQGSPVKSSSRNIRGDYYYNNTNWEDAQIQLSNLKKLNNLSFYGVRYKGRSDNDNDIKAFNHMKNGNANFCLQYKNKINKNYDVNAAMLDCDMETFKQLLGNNVYDAQGGDYTSKFEEIFNSINNKYDIEKKEINATLIDKFGSVFQNSNGTKFESTLKIEDSKELLLGPVEISINEDSKTGWYTTNDGFTLKNGNNTLVSSNINPLIYWQQPKILDSCTSNVVNNSIKKQDYEYYNYICEEGYDNYNGYKIDLKINNLDNGTKKFTIREGFGFPSKLNFSTNVRCIYTFNTDKFISDYNEINNQLNNTRDERERYSLLVRKNDLDNVLKSVSNNVLENELVLYKDSFKNQNANLTIIYNDSERQAVEFVNTNEEDYKIDCQNNEYKNINGLNIITKKSCVANFSKKMNLPQTCLLLKGGGAVECSDPTKELNGGNKIYTKFSKLSGEINVNIPNTGILKNNNVSLTNTETDKRCVFDVTKFKNKVIYRQIDISDPFVQKYKQENKRSIGKNYLGNKYNFTGIIKSNIWSEESEFKYLLSKVNVDNIKNDSYDSNTYLGSNCYITAAKKYECDFTRNRNSLEYGDTNYFTNVSFK